MCSRISTTMTKTHVVDKNNRNLLQLSCAEIVFPHVPYYEASSFLLTAINVHDKRVALKIKLPKDVNSGYRCYPRKAILRPGERVDIDLAMLPDRFQCQDELLLMTAEVPNDAKTFSFKNLSEDEVLRVVLPCQIEKVSPCISETSISESNKSELLAGDYVTSASVPQRHVIPNSTGDASLQDLSELSELILSGADGTQKNDLSESSELILSGADDTQKDDESLKKEDQENISKDDCTDSFPFNFESEQFVNIFERDTMLEKNNEVKDEDFETRPKMLPSLHIQEGDTLWFPDCVQNRESYSCITIQNKGDSIVAFKLKLSKESTPWYRLAPAHGYLAPHEIRYVDVFMLPGQRENPDDTILLLAAETDDVSKDVNFSQLSDGVILTKILKCCVEKSESAVLFPAKAIVEAPKTNVTPEEFGLMVASRKQVTRMTYENLQLAVMVSQANSKLNRRYFVEACMAFTVICLALQLWTMSDQDFILRDKFASVLGYMKPTITGFNFFHYNNCFSQWWDQYKALARSQFW